MLRVSKYVNLSLYIAVFFVCLFFSSAPFISFTFLFLRWEKTKKKEKYLTNARGSFASSLVPVFSVSTGLYCTLNGCKSLVLFSLFRTGFRVFLEEGFMSKNVSVHDVWTSLPVLFSYMKTLFLHNVFLWMLTCFCTCVCEIVRVFGCVCVWSRESMSVCMHAHTFCRGVSSVSVHISCSGGGGIKT